MFCERILTVFNNLPNHLLQPIDTAEHCKYHDIIIPSASA